ncbi:MAG: hypothetical protein JWQ34_2050 [Mucilaginibacter sp.]|uniref:hypothetical protein n=1 Tax=Mucilaginibacter sp. TaxID=1882438 RepID=UPI00261E5F76|nr:hypothetical protein [Mucilaginibacter sp.]MDB5003825.1 hypothetical protein [Mucilaginibacter sp.]
MKKLIMTAVIATMISVTAFADGGKKTIATGEESITYTVLAQFKSDFSTASNVAWTVTSNCQKATFTENNISYTAFYDLNNEYWGVSQDVAYTTLSESIKNKIAKNYKSYEVKDVTKFESKDGEEPVVYFVSLKKADDKIVLTIAPDNEIMNVEKN